MIDLRNIVPPQDYDLAHMVDMLEDEEGGTPWPLGIEMEYEGVRFVPSEDILQASGWRVVEDRSLRNHGKEFKTAGPVYGINVGASLEELAAWAKEARYSVSGRCGFHIHMDVRMLTTDHLCRVAALWAIIEERVFSAYPPDREFGGFCIPWFSGSQAAMPVWRLRNQEAVREKAELVQNVDKYTSLNMGPIVTYGSIEFRVPPATQKVEDMLETANFCAALMHTAVSMTDEELRNLGPHQALTAMIAKFPAWGNLMDRMSNGPVNPRADQDARDILVERCLGINYFTNNWRSKTTEYLRAAVRGRGPITGPQPIRRTPLDPEQVVLDEFDRVEIMPPEPPPPQPTLGDILTDARAAHREAIAREQARMEQRQIENARNTIFRWGTAGQGGDPWQLVQTNTAFTTRPRNRDDNT